MNRIKSYDRECTKKTKKNRPYKQNYYTLHPHPLRRRSSVGGLELQQISLLFGLGRSLRHLCLSEGRYEVRAQVLGGLVVPEVGREAAPHNAVEDCASGSQALVGVRGRAVCDELAGLTRARRRARRS